MKTTLVIAIFVIVVLGFFFDVILGGKVLLTANPSLYDPWRSYAGEQDLHRRTYRMDSILTYLPRRAELSQSIASGRFPLWNPSILTGAPFFADPQSRVLYPISLLLVPFNAEKAMGYDVAVHFLLAIIGMYLFLRTIAASTPGAILGAFAFGFSSFFANRMGHPTFVASAAWIPFLFYGFERARRSERTGTIMLAAFFVMGYLSGFPQVFIFGVAGLVIYALSLALDQRVRGARGQLLASARTIGISGGLALLVVAVHLIPFWEFLRNSVGLGIGLDQMRQLYVSKPVMLLRVVLPGFFGNPVEGTNWVPLIQQGAHPYNLGFMVYCGVGTLMATLGGLAFIRQSEHVRGLLLILLLSVGIGTSGFLLKVVYAAIPLFRYSQIDRISVMACFAIAALAGKSLSLLASTPDRRSKRVFLAVAGAVVVFLVAGSIIFAFGGDGIASRLIEKSHALLGKTWSAVGSERIVEWVQGRGPEWLAYEKMQIVRGLILASVSWALLLVCGLASSRRKRLAGLASLLFVLWVTADIVLVARTYYVSEPSRSVFETEGIKVLREAAGTKGEWRTLNEESGTWVLPPNTNQLFGLESLRGRSTIMPRAYAYFLETGQEAGAAQRGRIFEGPGPTPELAGLMSVRYLLRSGFDPTLTPSSVFQAVAKEVTAKREGVLRDFKILNLGGEGRLAFCQRAGETLSVDTYIPSRARIDFFFGFEGVPSDVDSMAFVVIWESPTGEAEFRRSLGVSSGGGRWYEGSLDVASVGAGYGRLALAVLPVGAGAAKALVSPTADDSGVRHDALAGWGGFEFVLSDCAFEKASGGYVVYPGRTDEKKAALSLEIAGPAREVPLEIQSSSGKLLRRVSFPPYLRMRRVMVDLGEKAVDRLLVRSDSSFSLLASRLVYGPHPEATGYDLIYTGDMYIYENAAAMEKVFCVAASEVRLGAADGSRILKIGERLADLPNMRCGKSEIVSYKPEKVEIEVSPDRDAFLIVQDAYYPGWKASVDGKRAEILLTDVGTRAIEIGRGDHRVIMEFKPGTLSLGLIVTCLGLLAGILYGLQIRFGIKT